MPDKVKCVDSQLSVNLLSASVICLITKKVIYLDVVSLNDIAQVNGCKIAPHKVILHG